MSSTPEAIRTQILALVKEYHMARFAPKTFDPDKDLVHYAAGYSIRKKSSILSMPAWTST